MGLYGTWLVHSGAHVKCRGRWSRPCASPACMSAASRGRGRVPDWPQYLSWDKAGSRGVRGDTGKLSRMRSGAKRHRAAEGFDELLSGSCSCLPCRSVACTGPCSCTSRCGVNGGLAAAARARSTAVGSACAHVLALPTAAPLPPRRRPAAARPPGRRRVHVVHVLFHCAVVDVRTNRERHRPSCVTQ